TEYGHGGGALRDLLALPGMLLTDSLHFGHGMDVLGGLGWELIFWTAPLMVWAAWRDTFLRAALLFCGLYLCCWFATGVVLRFLVPLAPLLCLLAGNALWTLWQRLGRGARAILAGAAGLFVLTHVLLFLFVQFGVFSIGNVLLGLETRQEFLSRRLEYY